MRALIVLIALSTLVSCSTQRHDQDDLLGAWMYFDVSDMYIEVLISDDHFITHNEVIGTTVSEVLKKNRSSIKISDFDDSPVKYDFRFKPDGRLILFNEHEELILTPIKVNIDIEKFGNEDLDEMDKYDQGFESRKNSATENISL